MKKKRFITYVTLTIFCLTSVFPRNVFPLQRFNDKSISEEISKLSQEIVKEISKNQEVKKRKISLAVIDFIDVNGNVTENGQILADEFTVRFEQTKEFMVIERNYITKLIAEQKFSVSGLVDANLRKKLGKILGVDAIVYGKVVEGKKNARVYVYVSNTETGEILGSGQTTIKCHSVSREPSVFWKEVGPYIGLTILIFVCYKLGLVKKE